MNRDRKHRILGVTAAATLLLAGIALAAVMEIRDRRSFVEKSASVLSTRLASTRVAGVGPTKIALIGDSWVARNKLDALLASSLEEQGLSQVQVLSYGEPGAKSRRILQNLFADETEPYSSAAILRDPSIRHCIVIAGLNDAAGYIGADFYAHHMIEIARSLISHGVRPLIVEVPEYGIEHLERRPMGAVRTALFRNLFDGGEIDVVLRYRTELERQLLSAGLRDRVTLIDFETVAADYEASASLYRDPAHLNEVGHRILADLLAETVARELSAEIDP